MKKLGLVLTLLIALSGSCVAETVLGVFPVDGMEEVNVALPEDQGVQVSYTAEGSADGGGALTIHYTGTEARDVMLFEVPLAGVKATRFSYEASLSSTSGPGRACIAMWCTVAGRDYFSRALNQMLEGGTAWRRCNTPFVLQQGKAATRARLGVRFESGPATVRIDNVRFVEGATSRPGGSVLGMACGFAGALVGILGGVSGTMASRGSGRRFVLFMWLAVLAAALAVLAAGLFFLLQGAAYGVWYPLVLTGGLISVLDPIMLVVIMRRYEAVERARMAAVDQSGSL